MPPGETDDGEAVAVTDDEPVVATEPAVVVPVVPTAPEALVPVVPAVPAAPVEPAVAETPALAGAPAVADVVPVVDAAEPIAGDGYVGDAGVVGCVMTGVAAEATLPACIVDGRIVGLVIVIGAEPTPPPTQPDIVIVPVADDPGVCGGVIVVAVCANTVVDVATKIRAGNDGFIVFPLSKGPAAAGRPIPESSPVISATLPVSLRAGLQRPASNRGRCSMSASRPGFLSFWRGNGGLGSDSICGLTCGMRSNFRTSITTSARLAS